MRTDVRRVFDDVFLLTCRWSLQTASLTSAKRDIKEGSSSLIANKIANRVSQRFGIPMTEQLLYTGYAHLADADYNILSQVSLHKKLSFPIHLHHKLARTRDTSTYKHARTHGSGWVNE